jgi:hypothetical protein
MKRPVQNSVRRFVRPQRTAAKVNGAALTRAKTERPGEMPHDAIAPQFGCYMRVFAAPICVRPLSNGSRSLCSLMIQSLII